MAPFRLRTTVPPFGVTSSRYLAGILVVSLVVACPPVVARDGSAAPAVSRFEMTDPTQSFALSGRYAYAVNYQIGWGVSRPHFEVLDVMESVQLCSIPISDSPWCVAADNQFVYLGGFEFSVLDVSDPTAPHAVATYRPPDFIVDIALAQTRAYCLDPYRLNIVDISNPTAPTPLGSVALPGAQALAVNGHYVFVPTFDGRVVVVDASDPALPSVVAISTLPGYALDVDVRGSHAYVVGEFGLRVLDVAHPTEPRLVGSVDMQEVSVRGIAVNGARAYLVTWELIPGGRQRLDVIDISNPTRPAVVNSIASGVAIDGNYELHYDVERVAAVDGRVGVGGTVAHVWLGDCAGFSCGYSSGFLNVGRALAYEVSPRSSPDGRVASAPAAPMSASATSTLTTFALRGNDPNPFNPETSIHFDVPRASHVRIRIYDAKGRLVRTLVDEKLQQGRHEAPWRGSTESGEAAASGIYFVTMDAEGFRQTRKITLLK